MRFLSALLITLLALPLVTSLGISPPSGTIEFSPNAEGQFDVLLINGRNEPLDTSVYISGELAEYFSADAPSISARGRSPATVSFALPEDVPPGENVVRIRWTEEFYDVEKGSVAAKVAVIGRFTVWKPYPGRYAELHVNPKHVPQGENTDMKIRIDSKGDQALRGDLRVRILSPEGTLMDTLTERIDVAGNDQFEEFRYVRSSTYPPGKYTVEASYDYGDGVAEHESSLIIGKESVDVISLTPTAVYKDKELTRFDVVLESLWNNELKAVSATVSLGENNASTPAITLPSFQQKTLTGYWELDENLPLGDQSARVTAIFLDGEPVTKNFPITVYNHTPQPEIQEPATVISLVDIGFGAVMLALIIYIFAVVLRRHQ